MARGWESKSVEEQMEAATSTEAEGGRKLLTPAQIEARRERENLLLCRTQVLRSLESCQSERYKTQLQQTLADLDSKLAKLAI